MDTKVPSWGKLSSRIALIGEAPGDHELGNCKCADQHPIMCPFVGPSGWQLNKWWRVASLSRRDFWIDNVIPYRGAGSKISSHPREEVEMWADHLWHTRLPQLEDPIVLVPTGNIALRAVMRKNLWSNSSPKIGDWRGSIIAIKLADGRKVKCIPTYHPAATFSDTSLIKLCVADWKRIATDQGFRSLRHPRYTRLVPPIDYRWVRRYLEAAQDPKTVMAIDIECPRKTMACVGFSYQPNEGLTLPWPQFYPEIKKLCESPCIKVGQNFLFDRWWLFPPDGLAPLAKKHWKMDHLPRIKMKGPIYDLLGMHHAIDATLPHDLATMASLDTRQPYWKRSWKDDEEDSNTNPFDLMMYNGIDICVSRSLYPDYREVLEQT